MNGLTGGTTGLLTLPTVIDMQHYFCGLIKIFSTTEGRSNPARSPLAQPVASLGWVTPGAAIEGVTPLFFPEKTGELFCSSLLLSLSLFIAFTRVSPPRGCHPAPFLPVRPRFSTILCKFAPKNFFPPGVTPLEGVTRGGPPRLPSDATAVSLSICLFLVILCFAFCNFVFVNFLILILFFFCFFGGRPA